MSEKKTYGRKTAFLTKNPLRKFFGRCNFRSTAFAHILPLETWSLDPQLCAQTVVLHKNQYWAFFTLAECRKGDFQRISCIFSLRAKIAQNSQKHSPIRPETALKVVKTPHTQIQTCWKYFSWIGRNFGLCGLGTYTGCRGANEAKKSEIWALKEKIQEIPGS